MTSSQCLKQQQNQNKTQQNKKQNKTKKKTKPKKLKKQNSPSGWDPMVLHDHFFLLLTKIFKHDYDKFISI